MANCYPRLTRIVLVTASIICVAVPLIVWWDHTTKMGTRLKVSDVESVNYSGSATEKEASDLGAALKTIGYFQGKQQIDVLLNKGPKGTILSFVVNADAWTKPEMEQAFREVAGDVAGTIGGRPLTVRLLDDSLVTRKEIKLD